MEHHFSHILGVHKIGAGSERGCGRKAGALVPVDEPLVLREVEGVGGRHLEQGNVKELTSE
jgi:hypothetical protein